MASTRGQIYDVALDGQGFTLVGDPTKPRIRTKQQTVFDRRFAQGDRDFSDFSFWWFVAQQDFSGSLKEKIVWADDTKFLAGRGIDAFSEPGKVSAMRSANSVKDFGVATFDIITAGAYDYVQGQEMILVGIEGDSSKIYESTDGSTLADVTAAGISTDWDTTAIRKILRMGFDDKFWIVSAGSDFTFSTWDGATHSDATAAVQGAESLSDGQGLAKAGGRGWAAFKDATSPADLIILSSTDGATWTKRVTVKGPASWKGGVDIGGDLIYCVSYESNIVELHHYDVANDTDAVVKRWIGKSMQTFNLAKSRGGEIATLDGSTAYILFDDGGIWSYDGSDVTELWRDVNSVQPSVKGFGLVEHNGFLYGPNLVITPDGRVFPGAFDGGSDNILPMFSSKFNGGNLELFVGSDTSAAKKVELYKLTLESNVVARVDTNEMDFELPGIDKLFVNLSIFFDQFTTSGQSFEVQYSINGGSSYTSLGTASQSADGNISSKEFFFGTNITGKAMRVRVILINNAATTPKFKSFSVRALPFPEHKTQWTFTVNCGNDIRLKDGESFEEKDGEWLRNFLRNAWWKKQILDYEDTDGEAYTLNGNLSIAATTVPTNQQISEMPELGRIRIGNEEMQYSGKQESSFLSVTRGARGTLAATHSDDDVVSTLYKVVIAGYEEQIIISNKTMQREYHVTLTLLEA